MEEQQSESIAAPKEGSRQPLTPEEQHRRQELEVLRLALSRTRHNLEAATNERHQQQLGSAIADLERRIAELDKSR